MLLIYQKIVPIPHIFVLRNHYPAALCAYGDYFASPAVMPGIIANTGKSEEIFVRDDFLQRFFERSRIEGFGEI